MQQNQTNGERKTRAELPKKKDRRNREHTITPDDEIMRMENLNKQTLSMKQPEVTESIYKIFYL